MNKKFTKLMAALALLVFMTPSLAGWGQNEPTTLYSETFGSSSSNVVYASYNGYTALQSMFVDQSATVASHYSGIGKVGKSSTQPSSGYSEASGNSAAWYTGQANSSNTNSDVLVISGISIQGYSDLNLSFGIKKHDGTSTTNKTTITYQIDNGTIKTLSFTHPTDGDWVLCSGSIEGTGTSLTIHFSTYTTGGYTTRYDDIKVTGITSSTDPSINADNVSLTWDATSGSIAYSINNPVEGGAITSATVTASNPSGWLTVSNTLTSPVGLTCAANTVTSEKTATVTLTYTYNTNETVTKDVTVTQAAMPTYAVTYNANGASGNVPFDATQYTPINNTVTVLGNVGSPALAIIGYSWSGWCLDAECEGTVYGPGDNQLHTFIISKDTTFYAKWNINSYGYTLSVTGEDANASAQLKVDNAVMASNAEIEYNKEVTILVEVSQGYAYSVSVTNNTTSQAVTVTNNKFTMPDSPVTVTVITEVNPFVTVSLTENEMDDMIGNIAYYNIKTVTVDELTWTTNGQQETTRKYIQIRARNNNSGPSWIKLPDFNGKIESITMSVRNGSGNNCTSIVYFNDAVTNNNNDYIVYGGSSTGTQTITLDLSGKFYSTGYLLANGVARMMRIDVVYRPYENLNGITISTIDADRAIAIPADANVTAAEGLTIPASSGILIKSGASLSVTGTLTNSGTAANLVIEDGGQLNTTSANIEATMKKTITGHENNLGGGWNFIASPMASTVITNTAHTNVISGNYDLYRFNQSVEDEWENYKAVDGDENPLHSDFTSLVNGKGYLYANDTTIDVAFMGTLANPSSGEVSVSYDGSAALKGWNLVGNPFTCNAFLSGGFYTTGEPGAVVVACENTTPIAPCEGAMVYVESAGTVTFSKTAPQTTNNGNVSIAVVQANERGASTTTVDKAIVSFNEGSELPKFYFGNPNANLYIPQGEKEYAIATSEGQGEMPLNFRANADGQYTLTVNPEGVEMNYLHLIDNMTGNDIDLLQTPSYSFNAKTTDYESRFRLVFASNGASTSSATEETFAFFSNGNLVVNNEGEATLQVIDVMGRVLSNQTISGTAELSLNQQPGVYVLRLVNGNDVKTQKIVVR